MLKKTNNVSIVILSTITLIVFDILFIVWLNVVLNHKNIVDFIFCNYYYVIVKTRLFYNIDNNKSNTKKEIICFDFEYSLTLNDCDFIKKQFNEIKIRKLIFSILVRNVNEKIIKIDEYVITQLYIDNFIINNKLITICIIAEIYLMNNLKVNLLFNVNVLKSQKIILNFKHNTLIINNC